MVGFTGQVWAMPNEIGNAAMAFAIGIDAPLSSTSADFEVISQSTFMLLE